jgi:hypothetical protein
MRTEVETLPHSPRRVNPYAEDSAGFNAMGIPVMRSPLSALSHRKPGAPLFAPPPAAVPIGRYSPARRMVIEDERRERRRKSRVLACAGAVLAGAAVIFGGRW